MLRQLKFSANLVSRFIATSLLWLAVTSVMAVDARPLRQAHAHNDYRHGQPLLDALRHGFCSVEADIFLQDGLLLVGHDADELRPHRTLQSLYLDPLRERAASNGGEVTSSSVPFTLLVDIKSDGPATFAKLHEVLADYDSMCSFVTAGQKTCRAVDVVVSGNRPMREIKASSPRRVFLDGRIEDLEAPPAALLTPLVSDNWSKLFSWRGEGPMPSRQQAELLQLVDQVHQRQQRLRFWATPDDPRVWNVLAEAGVDLIGTDDLESLQRFLLSRELAPAAD